MKTSLLTVLFVMMLAAPAIMVSAVPAMADAAPAAFSHDKSEKAALAELLTARIKAALQGEEYRLDKSCDSEDDCTISIRP